jgi:transposase
LIWYFEKKDRMRVTMEVGGSSQWTSRLVEGLGHELVLCIPRRIRLIAETTVKSDEIDAEVLARLGRIDPGFSGGATHRSEEAQLLQVNLTVRSSLVKSRANWVKVVQGVLRGFGYRVLGGTSRNFPNRCAKVEIPGELKLAIQPILNPTRVPPTH